MHVLDGLTLLSFSRSVHKLLHLAIPPNVSMINNGKLAHQITDINGKQKIVASSMRN